MNPAISSLVVRAASRLIDVFDWWSSGCPLDAESLLIFFPRSTK